MKKFMNFVGEVIYDLTDYTMIIIVLVIISGVLFWRFNALFNLSVDKDMIENPVMISEEDNKDKDEDSSLISDSDNLPNNHDTDENPDDTSSDQTASNENSDDGTETSSSENNETDNSNEEDTSSSGNQSVSVNVDVKFTIPTGTFPSQIADILIDNRLIDDKQEFLARCVELGLDTKLKAGDFTINTSSSLDDIIYRLAK